MRLSAQPPWLALAVLLGLLCKTPSARAETDSEFQAWSALFMQWQPQSSGPAAWFDFHIRRSSNDTLAIVRPAIGWQWWSSFSTHIGYAWVPRFIDGTSDVHEHRIWQQLLFNHELSPGLHIALRPRTEQRFNEGEQVGHRARLFARMHFVPKYDFLPWFVAWDELFVQLNSTEWGLDTGFDQNRLFLGVGFPSTIGARFEVGYLNVFLSREPNDSFNHVFALNAFVAFP